ncbi:MAG: phenylalanine 4-monooxygenase [Deltaproteobacteria bacterium]|nr:phenylalanine 4-monooxygenase [Deltaproteobacteria bacterium]
MINNSKTSSPFVGASRADDPLLVELDQDHPGFRDPKYRERRNFIAQIAQNFNDGQDVPDAPYTDEEHAVWAQVMQKLEPLFASQTCREVKEAMEEAKLPHDHIPQFSMVNARLKANAVSFSSAQGDSGIFQMRPVAGLVDGGDFLSFLGRGLFLGTQYVRHFSKPFYTPEPDVLHELVGHATTLTHPRFAKLNRLFGAAVDEQPPERVLEVLRAYWYTIEFGLVKEAGEVRAYGAGLLSSFGELGRFNEAKILPLDLDECAALPFEPTCYQDTLFCAESFSDLEERLSQWLVS